LPKRYVDVQKNELMRCLKLTANSIEFVSFNSMRKAESFQDDLYPDCIAGEPALTASKWLEGTNADPKRKSLKFDHP